MPALSAFGKKWNISSDDFVFPGLCLLVVRSTWLLIILIEFGKHRNAFDCESGQLLEAFFFGMMVLLPTKIVVNIALMYFSAQGRILDYWERKHVTRILYVKVPLLVVEVIWYSLATYWAFSDSMDCEWHVVLAVRVLTGMAWFGFFVVLVAIILLNPLDHNINPTTAARMWKRRCKCFCCTFRASENTNAVYQEIADFVSTYFEGLDLVPTDIVAGMILVSREQSRRANQLTCVTGELPASRSFGDRNEAVDISSPAACSSNEVSIVSAPTHSWMNIPRAARYMKYALACYGWPMYSLAHFPLGCCALCCFHGPDAKLGTVVDDNCCQCHIGAVKRTIDVQDAEVLYACFHNELYENPFLIIKDHRDKSIVVAIRGTLSLNDAMVDMTVMGEKIQESSSPDHLAHKGMLKAAYTLKRKLISNALLGSAFDNECSDYRLVICGHSLGAGVAAILAIILRDDYPNLQCFSYSPPGGLLSWEAAEASKDIIMSVIVGADLVPRLGIQQMEDLKMRILQSLESCSKPKYKIFASSLCGVCFRHCCHDNDDDETMTSPLVRNGRQPNYSTSPNNLTESLHEAIITSYRSKITQPSFYPPGMILHISDVSEHTNRCCSRKIQEYTWKWSEKSNFCEIIVTPRMAADHMPDVILSALEQLAPDSEHNDFNNSNNISI